MNITVKRANLSDLDEIEKIESNLEHRILSFTTLTATLNQNNYYYIIAKINNTVVGYIAAQLLVDHFDLISIAVSKDFRRQNIATYLLDKLFDLCTDLKISDIFLEVRHNNSSAINLYEKAGFKRINVRKNYYTDTSEDAYIYLKVV